MWLKISFDVLALFLAFQARYNFLAALRNRGRVLVRFPQAKGFAQVWTVFNGVALACFLAASATVWITWSWGLGFLVAPVLVFLLVITFGRLFKGKLFARQPNP